MISTRQINISNYSQTLSFWVGEQLSPAQNVLREIESVHPIYSLLINVQKSASHSANMSATQQIGTINVYQTKFLKIICSIRNECS